MAKKKKAKRRYPRKKKGTKRRRVKGVLDKIGTILIGGVPVAVSTVEAVAFATARSRSGLPVMEKVYIGTVRWANNLTAGLFGKNILDQVTLNSQVGPYTVSNAWAQSSGEGTQAYPWLMTALTGLGMKAMDRIAGWLAGSGSKVAGITLTGGK